MVRLKVIACIAILFSLICATAIPTKAQASKQIGKPAWAKEIEFGKNHSVKAWIENGWLHAERKNEEGLIWRVPIAKADSSTPPQIVKEPGTLKIVMHDNRYFLKDDSRGFRATFLRLTREGRFEDESIQFDPRAYGLEFRAALGGNDTRSKTEWEHNGWIYFGVGNKLFPNVGAIFRLIHSSVFEGRGVHGSRAGDGFYIARDDYDIFYDGELMVAKLMDDQWFARRTEQMFGLKGQIAPRLSVSKWLNVSNPLSLKELRGNVTLLDFWGTWCTPCIKQAPTVNALYEKYKNKGMVVIGVHSKHKAESVDEFIKQQNLTFPIAIDNGQSIKDYSVAVWPAYFLIDKQGKVRKGNLTKLPSDHQIELLLKERAN